MSAFTMYTTQWCGFCGRLKSQLAREGLEFTEVDIDHDPRGAEVVTKANHGNRTVPTVVFSDGSTLTNPSVDQVSRKLAALS